MKHNQNVRILNANLFYRCECLAELSYLMRVNRVYHSYFLMQSYYALKWIGLEYTVGN